MGSPAPRPERAGRALDTSRRLRLLAITLWASFLGAALIVTMALGLLPPEAVRDAGLAGLSVGFFCAWVAAAVTISMALMLALPLERRDGG